MMVGLTKIYYQVLIFKIFIIYKIIRSNRSNKYSLKFLPIEVDSGQKLQIKKICKMNWLEIFCQ